MRKSNFNHWWVYGVCLSIALVIALCTIVKAQEKISDSPAPILISENDSTRALAVNSDQFGGSLPKTVTHVFEPGADTRFVLFVTNLNLIDGEGANAFRVYAEDAQRKVYRLSVEDITPLGKQNWIYALTVRLYDLNGYNGQPLSKGDVLLRLTWRGMTSNRVRLGCGATGGIKDDKGAQPTPAPLSPPSNNTTDFAYSTGGDRNRFMQQAAFGPSATLDFRLRQIGIGRWIDEQFNKQPTFPYPNVSLQSGNAQQICGIGNRICIRDSFSEYPNQNWMFKEALYGDDQLRRRVSWALAQIWVASAFDTATQTRRMLEYYKIFDRNAFGNWRDLMQEMTLNPQMGDYLDMMRSTNVNPNENYPREVLQLFNVGLFMLNQDGTPILNQQGLPVSTYDQDKITNFTKVFTGWTPCNQVTPACPNATVGVVNFIDPMRLNANNHDLTAKSLFAYTQVNGQPAPYSQIPACLNCTTDANRVAYGNASLSQTLDNVFYHPNVGPFVATRLIQHLVTGDPSPAYVARVAAAFNDNGQGVRGDMKTVIRAVLLDPEARGSQKTAPDYGKLREPFQLVTNLLRQFDVKSADQTQQSDGYLNPQTMAMGEDIWNSPTVFNYFSSNYILPGTDLNEPEFGIFNSGTSFARSNFVNTMVYGKIPCTGSPTCSPTGNAPLGTSISLAEPQGWAQADLNAGDTNYTQLVEGLNNKMMHGAMSDQMKTRIRAGVQMVPTGALNRALAQAQQAVYLIATSSQYQVQR
ncbi:MAG: DUF1800 family protein [Pyrinomonadaceae bacterium]